MRSIIVALVVLAVATTGGAQEAPRAGVAAWELDRADPPSPAALESKSGW